MPTRTRLTDDAASVMRLRLALARTSRRLRGTEAGRDISPTQQSMLGAICVRGPISLSALARREGVNPTMLSRIIGKLEARGLVLRETDPGDRRSASVSATPAGSALQASIIAERTASLVDHLATLPDEHLEALRTALPALEALAESLLNDEPEQAGPV